MNPADREATPSRFDFAVLAIVLLATAFRFYRINTPLLDAHSWRQVTNADIARHFALGSLNPFLPRVSWGGLNGIVGMEFPLLQWITGVLWRAFNEDPITARLVSVGFSIATVAMTYLVGARLFGRPAGRAAAFLMAVSPGASYFGHAFLSDSPMLTFMVASVWGWDRYFDRSTTGRALQASVLTALGPLVKLPAIIVLAGIFGLAWSRRQWSLFQDRPLVAGVALSVFTVAAWYWHADRIYLQTGLTEAIFRPSNTYPASIAPGVAFSSVFHWATRDRLLSLDFWTEMADRFWWLHLTPIGSLGVLIGIGAAWRAPRGLAMSLWLLGGVALFVASAEGQFWHEFHQLPLMPPLAFAFGLAAAPLFDGALIRRHLRTPAAPLVVAAALVLAALEGFRTSGVSRHLYRPDNLQYRFVADGNVVQTLVPPDALVMTVDYDKAGVNSPMLLYYARRQGWSFDVSTLSPPLIEHLRTTHELKFFATSYRREVESDRPQVVTYLNQFETVPVPAEHTWLWVVDLQRRRPMEGEK